ncbi:MAG TPA: exodeoxyribonuclease VII large subunit [Treponemataceae bacterium]|nr:exodeoxyribonuclease VII large subunit [Spirochaetaceae bacterium]HOE09430.1 exodeoxyribonuclease VII large subunit [Treponemataceae bacterium]HQL03657.1 exodeoxyribonuclease VII large subunit [Treponemataceae bacterium]
MSNTLFQDFSSITLTVSDLTGIIKELLEGSFPLITVEGEISNYRPSSTGHIYFTLKDEHASISAVLFKGKSRYLAFTPKDGMKIRAKGSLSVYAQRGSYQIVIDSMEETGSGDILKLLEQRKRALAEEGLFDSERKQNIPYFPRCIGVVTSPTGAALRDVLQILNRRNPKVSVIILPCPVQGSDAGKIIAKQIDIANVHNLCDVLIVGRGGGSLEDLLPFSEEEVVRSIAASKIPVISAVGHEIDWALSDYAADVRAPTPSAAAELAVPPLDEINQALENYVDSFEQTINHKLEHTKALVRSFSSDNLELRFRSIEQPLLQRFDDAKEDLLDAMKTLVSERRQALQMAVLNLESLNPLAILERGFSVVTDAESGRVITDAAQTNTGAALVIRPFKGSITAQVTNSAT